MAGVEDGCSGNAVGAPRVSSLILVPPMESYSLCGQDVPSDCTQGSLGCSRLVSRGPILANEYGSWWKVPQPPSSLASPLGQL